MNNPGNMNYLERLQDLQHSYANALKNIGKGKARMRREHAKDHDVCDHCGACQGKDEPSREEK